MHIRARALGFSGALFAAIFLVTSTAAVAQQPPPQQKKDEKKLDKAQQQEIAAAVKTVDEVIAGQPGPSDATINWQYHFMKARDQRTFVPIVLTFDNTLKGPIVFYLRVVNHGATPPPAAATEAKKGDKPAAREYPFEDIRFLDVKPSENGQPHHLTRAISVPAGEYDVYVLLRERVPNDAKKNAPPPKGGLLKQTIAVPNFWSDELMTSSVMLSSKVEQLTAPPTDAEIASNPYVFGATKITPSIDNRFKKSDELSILFQIYNTAPGEGGKPDVMVEYNFYQKLAGAEKFFNKTEPQSFNAKTLPPQFDLTAGHTLVGGQSIPLASFPEGDYRLEIKVTDKAGSKTKVENVALTVGA